MARDRSRTDSGSLGTPELTQGLPGIRLQLLAWNIRSLCFCLPQREKKPQLGEAFPKTALSPNSFGLKSILLCPLTAQGLKVSYIRWVCPHFTIIHRSFLQHGVLGICATSTPILLSQQAWQLGELKYNSPGEL